MTKLRLSDTPSVNWFTPANVMPDTTPIYQQGAVYYANFSAQLQAVDFQTGATNWTTSLSAQPVALQSPVWVNGVIYVATDAGQLYAVNPVTGDQIWNSPVTLNGGGSLSTPKLGLGYVNGAGQQNVLYLMDDQNVYLVPLIGQNGAPPVPQTVFTAPTGVTLATSLVYDASTGYMVLNTNQGLTAVQANLGSLETWSQVWQAQLGGYVTPATLAMGKLFVGTAVPTIAVLDITSGESLASANLNSLAEHPILVYPNSNTAFVPTKSGIIEMFDATSVTKTSQIQPGAQVTTPLTLGDNLVYYGSADNKVYSFDVTDPSGNVVSYNAEAPIVYMAGVTSANAYFGTSENLHSAAFAGVMHQFNSQSQFMVDYVLPAQAVEPQQVPSYQSHITLYDAENNIRPNEAVKVWSVTPTVLNAVNQTFSIGPDTPAAFQSDSSGKIALSVAADLNIQPGVGSGLSTPALLLWASFMDPQERILIYPDQRLHAKLQTITGADLQNATLYPSSSATEVGTPLLPAGFQGANGLANANALATAINNTISFKSPSATLTADVSTQYLAFPSTMVGVQYCASAPDTTRLVAPAQIPNWTLNLTDPSTVVFTPNATAAEAELRASTSRDVNGLGPAGSIFTDIGHFISNVIHGIEHVVETIWQAAENAVKAVIVTAENTYNLVVQTIEDAAHVVLGILKSVVTDVENAVESVIQALSWLFSWKDIIATHDQIKTILNNAFTNSTSVIGAVQAQSDAFFDGLLNTITTDFSTLIAKCTGSTLGGATQNYSDPNQAYSHGSDNYSVQGNWLYHKSMTGALGPNGSVTVGGSTPMLAAQGVQESLGDAMAQFLQTVAADAIAIAENLAELVLSAVKELLIVITDPAKARGANLGDLLKNLEGLLLSLVQLGKDAAHGFFTLLQVVVELVQRGLNTPIRIPLISELYQWITGDSLTILDMFCLIVAVPTTIVYKAITGNSPFNSSPGDSLAAQPALATTGLLGASASLNVENMIITFSGLIYVFVDAISNAMGNDSPPFLNYVEAVLIAIPQALGIPDQSKYVGGQLTAYNLLWLYEWFPVIWGVHCGAEQGAGNTTSNVVLPFHGVGTAIWEGIYAITYPSDFFDDGIKLAQNELGALSTIAGFAKLSENEEVLAVMVAACFFLDMGNAMIEVKYWWS